MIGSNTQVGNHKRTTWLRDSTIVPVAAMATEANNNGKNSGFKSDQLRDVAVSRPECNDGSSSKVNPRRFAKIGRVFRRSSKRECNRTRTAVRQARMAVLIQKNTGVRAGKPAQTAMSSQVGKYT